MNSISKTLKLSETETVNPREDLTEPTAPAPVNDKTYIPCPARGLRRVKRSDFQSKSNKRTIKPTPVSRRVKKYIPGYRNEFNRNKLKLSETETVNPREDLTEVTAPAPVAIKAYSACPARGLRRVKRSDFQS